MITLRAADLAAMEKIARVQLATSLPGAKPVSLIGSTDSAGRHNLAPFSSVVHLGSNPVLIGMISRPDLVDRHTLANLQESGAWTINHLHPEIVDQAHQCSARYPKDVSEFAATGLSESWCDGFPAPFVAESRFRIGLRLEQVVEIPANGTHLVVGRVEIIELPREALAEDGSVDFEALEIVASTALDTYLSVRPLARLAYAKPGQPPRRLA